MPYFTCYLEGINLTYTDGQFLDELGQAEVRRGHSKLSERGAAVPDKVQTTLGTPVQDWYVCSFTKKW